MRLLHYLGNNEDAIVIYSAGHKAKNMKYPSRNELNDNCLPAQLVNPNTTQSTSTHIEN